jgi:hypothetical protein
MPTSGGDPLANKCRPIYGDDQISFYFLFWSVYFHASRTNELYYFVCPQETTGWGEPDLLCHESSRQEQPQQSGGWEIEGEQPKVKINGGARDIMLPPPPSRKIAIAPCAITQNRSYLLPNFFERKSETRCWFHHLFNAASWKHTA